MKRFASILFQLILVVFLVFPVCLFAQSKKDNAPVILTSRHKVATAQGSNVSEHKQGRFQIISLAGAENFKRKPQHVKQIYALRPDSLAKKVSSRSAMVLDAKTGRTLFAMKENVPGQPASTIKILTGLIAMESLSDKDWVFASRYAASMPRSKVYLKKGKSYRANDLINSVLLSSANDASVALAEKLAGSEKAFARLMTRKAKALGARQTVCKSASGLTRRGQQTTARDLVIMFNNAMQNQEFAKRMTYKKVRASFGKTLRTHNKALWTVEGALGGKTGYTRAARQTYVGKFKRRGQEVVVAIMGSETMWEDISTLVEYGFYQQGKSAILQTADRATAESIRVPVASISAPKERKPSLSILTGPIKKTKM